MAKRTCCGRHLMEEEDKEEGENMANQINTELVDEAMAARKINPAIYPRALGIDIFSDDPKLNKLHKEHQIILRDYEKALKNYKTLTNARLNGEIITDSDFQFIRFWKNIFDNTNACIRTGRDATVSAFSLH